MSLLVRTALVLLMVGPSLSSGQPSRDSLAARRAAERAQTRFERVRRMNLPLGRSARSDRCDARIGRFCHWNSEEDSAAPREPAAIKRARASLLGALDSLGNIAPRDGWITGQRVRYLLESGADSLALAVVSVCAAEEWWCDALRGLVLHESGRGAEADSSFARALGAMPEAERCRWTDVTPLLDDRQRKSYGRVGCGRREEIARRVWWLADAFFSVPGNDRQAEHFARHTMSLILRPARNAYNISWADDYREMIVRYGWARYWTKESPPALHAADPVISGHEATPNYRFIPVSLDSLHEIGFDLDQELSPERYSPVMANRLRQIAPQVALFRRGDSARVVAAFDVSKRRPFDSANVQSSLVVGANDSSMRLVSASAGRGALSIDVDGRPHVMSLEVVSFDHRHAAWHRAGVWLPRLERGEADVSDLLLFEPGDEHITDLEAAIRLALPGTTVKRGKTGVYWEMYGLARADSALPVTLALTPIGRGGLRRLGESIGLISRATPLNIGWRDVSSLAGIHARSVVLDLSLVPRGRYELRLEARPKGREAIVSRRVITIE